MEIRKLAAGLLLSALLLSTFPTGIAFADEDTGIPQETITTDGGDPIDTTVEEPDPLVTENSEDGEDGSLGDDGTTGGQVSESIASTTIVTGDATAFGDSTSTANTDTFNSIIDPTSATSTVDIDEYTLTATGTSIADVTNTASSTAESGVNVASSTESSQIETGDAVAVLNVANVINTNIVNSVGMLLLLNEIFGEGSYDLRDFDLSSIFYPTYAQSTPMCNLTSCYAEEINYNVSNTNTANVTNNGVVRAIAGQNTANGAYAGIGTGNAYAAANLLNVVNTNIIDSNYLLVAVNGIGDLTGDLVLPNGDFFTTFFGQQNAMARAEESSVDSEDENTSLVNNGVTTTAETGLNEATTTDPAHITTGTAHAHSNVINEINKTLFGGDSLYILVKVQGNWSGNVFGLPEGIAWEQTPDGIAIYSTGPEIVPSVVDYRSDVDEYNAEFDNTNDATIDNSVEIYALTGENKIAADDGVIDTGDAFAGSNVYNIANTNVVGRNWVMALFNILGDFNGDISFGRPDLFVAGMLETSEVQVQPDSVLSYTYTVTNNGDLKATDVIVEQEFDPRYLVYPNDGVEGTQGRIRKNIGTLRPGESREIGFKAIVRENLPDGSTPLVSTTRVSSREPENDAVDNTEVIELVATYDNPGQNSGSGNEEGNNSGGDTGGNSGEVAGASDNQGGGNDGGGGGSKPTPASELAAARSQSIARADTTAPADSNAPSNIKLIKTSNARGKVKAGSSVDYVVTVRNSGGYAHNALLVDTLLDAKGEMLSEQSWELGDILPDEEIQVTYTIEFDEFTPDGLYTNTAHLDAYENKTDVQKLAITDAKNTVTVDGPDLAIKDLKVVGTYGTPDNVSALIEWETNMAADGQLFYGKKSVRMPNPAKPNFGYESASAKFPAKVTKHSMLISGLKAGESYTVRALSKTDTLEAMSDEERFTVSTFDINPTLPPPAAPIAPLEEETPVVPPAVPENKVEKTTAVVPSVSNVVAVAQEPEVTPTPEQKADTPAPAEENSFNLAAAYAGLPLAFAEFVSEPINLLAFLLILALIAAFARLVRDAIATVEPRSWKRVFITAALLLIIALAIAYTVSVYESIRLVTLGSLGILALWLLMSIRSRIPLRLTQTQVTDGGNFSS